MPEMNFQHVDRYLIEALPALLVPHARCLAQDFDGEHPGQYNVFEPVFRACLAILLALPASPARDDLLRHAFAFVERMFASTDPAVPNLAKIAIFEGQSAWWFARAAAFIGPAARAFLDMYEERWRGAIGMTAAPDAEHYVLDGFGVREALLRVLGAAVTGLPAIPGIGAPYEWQRLVALPGARGNPDAVVFLSCFGTGDPLVVAPAAAVACGPVALLQLARDLAARARPESDGREHAESACYAIPVGERVWRLRVGAQEHGRYTGTLWVAPQLLAQGIGGPIGQVLAGRQRRIPPVSP